MNSREVPKWMEPSDIQAVVAGFAGAAGIACANGMDGVEINAGQYSLIRQFLSGLTNHRTDEWGSDRLRFALDILGAVRSALGDDLVLGLRLSCDEMAPWAGVVPDAAAQIAATLCEAVRVDYLVVVRGSIYTASATRPDMHTEPGFNIELARLIKSTIPAHTAIFAQGSIVSVADASHAFDSGACDGVEMTRAQIADADLVSKWAAGNPDRIRPCLLCNQTCQVRDPRNPLVTCVVDPSSGHEIDEPLVIKLSPVKRSVCVIGGGPGGLEAARVAALRGHAVTIVERSESVGGMADVASRGGGRHRLKLSTDWLASECDALGVRVVLNNHEISNYADIFIDATGSVAARHEATDPGAEAIDSVIFLRDSIDQYNGKTVVVLDGIGGPIAVSIAESLAHAGATVHFVTIDQVAGNELARTGDLAPANVRLQQLGVIRHLRSIVRKIGTSGVELEHRFSGAKTFIAADAIVDANHRLPAPPFILESSSHHQRVIRVGDAVAPRTILEAILEGRRAALSI